MSSGLSVREKDMPSFYCEPIIPGTRVLIRNGERGRTTHGAENIDASQLNSVMISAPLAYYRGCDNATEAGHEVRLMRGNTDTQRGKIRFKHSRASTSYAADATPRMTEHESNCWASDTRLHPPECGYTSRPHMNPVHGQTKPE